MILTAVLVAARVLDRGGIPGGGHSPRKGEGHSAGPGEDPGAQSLPRVRRGERCGGGRQPNQAGSTMRERAGRTMRERSAGEWGCASCGLGPWVESWYLSRRSLPSYSEFASESPIQASTLYWSFGKSARSLSQKLGERVASLLLLVRTRGRKRACPSGLGREDGLLPDEQPVPVREERRAEQSLWKSARAESPGGYPSKCRKEPFCKDVVYCHRASRGAMPGTMHYSFAFSSLLAAIPPAAFSGGSSSWRPPPSPPLSLKQSSKPRSWSPRPPSETKAESGREKQAALTRPALGSNRLSQSWATTQAQRQHQTQEQGFRRSCPRQTQRHR